MKNEQVVPDYKVMLETSFTLLALVASGWLLIKLVSACFWLPGFLKNWELEEEENIQKSSEESAESENMPTDNEKEGDDKESKDVEMNLEAKKEK